MAKKGGSKEHARRNFIAKDLGTEKYALRVKEVKKKHLIDELHRDEMDEDYWKYKLGMAPKE